MASSSMDVDLTGLADTKITECNALGRGGNLEGAIEGLLEVEKRARQAEDEVSVHRLCLAIVALCREVGDWAALNSSVVLISKRRGQYPQAIVKSVRACMEYLDDAPDLDTRLSLIDTLRLVCEGKIFVEVERARLTLMLAGIREEQGDIEGAADCIQDVQVETLGAMDKQEKVSFILEQMRLSLARHDYVRTRIIARKISDKALAPDDMQDLKLRYHKLMIEYYEHEGKNLSTCRSHQSIYSMPMVKADEDFAKSELRHMVAFVCLAAHDTDQQDILHRTAQDRLLEDMPAWRSFITLFVTKEMIRFDELKANFGNTVLAHKVFVGSEYAERHMEDLHKAIVEHNVRVAEMYYSRVRMSRLANLLGLDEAATEKYLSDMVVAKSISARIDRPAGVVVFAGTKTASAVLNEWSRDVGDLLALVETCTHNIQKENMMYGIGQ